MSFGKPYIHLFEHCCLERVSPFCLAPILSQGQKPTSLFQPRLPLSMLDSSESMSKKIPFSSYLCALFPGTISTFFQNTCLAISSVCPLQQRSYPLPTVQLNPDIRNTYTVVRIEQKRESSLLLVFASVLNILRLFQPTLFKVKCNPLSNSVQQGNL